MVKYIPGPQNIADCLSRLISASSDSEEPKRNDAETYIKQIAENSTPVAMTTRDIERASGDDQELEALRECIVNGRWSEIPYKDYIPVRSELCAIGKLVLRGTRIVIPESLRESVLNLGHEGHPGIVAMKQRIRSKVWWPKMDKHIEKHCQSCYGCQLMAKPSNPEPMARTELPSGLDFDIDI
ncbi:uncharacterized protein K02A2.6-like [Pecten maximus]|uniref:uncharacterized protein K02A2.6-like n=1 Tax=Pecten maximus TaxID=6579 RepID=UPI001458B23A|nr:uncharacterized protein K02A2.6-like [Pecten maximus]